MTGLNLKIDNPNCPATGITAYLKDGGALEASSMANLVTTTYTRQPPAAATA